MKSAVRSTLVLLVVTILFIDGINGQERKVYQPPPQLDEALVKAGNLNFGANNGATGRGLNSDITTSDGKYVLFELDELEPVPCEVEINGNGRRSSGATLVHADASVGSGSCSGTVRPPGEGTRERGGRKITAIRGNDRGSRRGNRGKRSATSDTRLRWPSKNIPYQISAPSSFEKVELDSINEAVAEYSKYTCLNLVRRTNQADYINVIRDGGCYSSVGWIYWDQPNRLSLGRGCAWNKNIPIHEFMHAIGIYHQQSRPDRDQYVRIHLENVQPGQTHNFFKMKPEEAEMGGTEYSYRSVMHYSKNAFSVDRANKNTITPIDMSYLDIIGRATTFSFEDLQLINYIYECDRGCTNTCPGKSYRDKNCNCWCPNGSNYDVPAVLCTDPSTTCDTVDKPCDCASKSNACSRLQNTQCNRNTGACECDSNSGLIDGTCYRLEEASCDKVEKNCFCSMKGSSACNSLQNTACNSQTNACECRSGYQLNANGVCEIASPCDRIGKSCLCSQKTNACSRLANSYCDLLTGKCECDEDFYAPFGFCTRAPACTTAGQSCKCSVQGQNACAAVSGSACDESSDACECLPSHKQTSQGTCQVTDSYISNGLSVSPFLQSSLSTSGNEFRPARGEEAEQLDYQFGVATNGWHLIASGRGHNRRGVIEVPPLSAGTWCIQYSYKMSYAVLWAEINTGGNDSIFRGNQANSVMRRFFGKELIYSTTSQLLVKFHAELHPGAPANTDWKVIMDPIVVKRC